RPPARLGHYLFRAPERLVRIFAESDEDVAERDFARFGVALFVLFEKLALLFLRLTHKELPVNFLPQHRLPGAILPANSLVLIKFYSGLAHLLFEALVRVAVDILHDPQ